MKQALFMIIQGEVRYNMDTSKDHREWYLSLGLDPNLFDTIVRGFVMNNQIFYYKGSNFMYDQEVIQAAKMYTPYIRYSLQNPHLEACCGITFSSPTEWEPIMKIAENEITGISSTTTVSKETKETGSLLELKNNYQDEKFIKTAILVTSIVFVISLVFKIILFQKGMTLNTQNVMDILLVFLQFFLLGATIYGYLRKQMFPKYTGVAASILLVFTFHIVDILLGIFYFIFCVDQNIYVSFINIIKGKIQNKNHKE
jgi:hypothetical protein